MQTPNCHSELVSESIKQILFHLNKIEELKKTFGVTEEQIYCAKYKQRELKDEIRHEQGN